MMTKEECLICKAPIEYLKEDIEMECSFLSYPVLHHLPKNLLDWLIG